VNPERPSISIEKVTPDTATEWLKQNLHNRNIRPGRVAEIARDMANGDFQFTGDPIKFSRDGELIDGQHRLAAVQQSGLTLAFTVVRGLPRTAQDVVDIGAGRTTADVLRIAGHSHPAILAAAARLVTLVDLRLINDTDHRRTRLTHAEVRHAVDTLGLLLERACDRVATLRHGVACPPSVLAAGYFLCERVADNDTADEFFSRLHDGAMLATGSPVLALRNRFSEIRQSRTYMTPPMHLSMILRAWNAWREGRTMAMIPAVKSGAIIRVPDPI
jgi:hypothetical protein